MQRKVWSSPRLRCQKESGSWVSPQSIVRYRTEVTALGVKILGRVPEAWLGPEQSLLHMESGYKAWSEQRSKHTEERSKADPRSQSRQLVWTLLPAKDWLQLLGIYGTAAACLWPGVACSSLIMTNNIFFIQYTLTGILGGKISKLHLCGISIGGSWKEPSGSPAIINEMTLWVSSVRVHK